MGCCFPLIRAQLEALENLQHLCFRGDMGLATKVAFSITQRKEKFSMIEGIIYTW